ncbi:MAG: ATP-binding protein [Alphaproteobacteria bacterium]
MPRFRFLQATSARIALIFVLLFGAFLSITLLMFRMQTGHLLKRQSDQTIIAEMAVLGETNRLKGPGGLTEIVKARSSGLTQTGSLYRLTDAQDSMIAGNLAKEPDLPPGQDEWVNFTYDAQGPSGEAMKRTARALIQTTADGYTMLVGRDIEDRLAVERQMDLVMYSIIATMLVLSVLTGFIYAQHVYSRLDTIIRTSRDIIAGKLSRRVPVSERGDEIDQVAENLNQMLDQVQRLMNAMREVTDNVAHDLRSPLNRMRSRMEVTLMQSSSEDEYRAALQASIDDANHLLGTFNALLSIARVEAGSNPDTLQTVAIADVVRDVAELYDALAEDEGMLFDCRIDLDQRVLRGNRELLSQALANLIDNAIKYTPKGGRIGVRLKHGEMNDMAVLSVSDSGPGIPEADRTRVLNRFVRLEASRNSPGSGLGLSLVSAVAHFHGGRLVLGDSALIPPNGREPSGLCASLYLPLVPAGFGAAGGTARSAS